MVFLPLPDETLELFVKEMKIPDKEGYATNAASSLADDAALSNEDESPETTETPRSFHGGSGCNSTANSVAGSGPFVFSGAIRQMTDDDVGSARPRGKGNSSG